MRRDRGLQRRRPANAPGRNLDDSLVEPAFDLVHQLDAISLLPRLKVEAFGAHAIVERRERGELVTGLYDGEGRAHPPCGVAAEEIATAEGVAPEHLVVSRIERFRAARGQLAARHAPHDRRHRLDRLIHLGRDVTERGIAVAAEPGTDTSRSALLATRPEEPCRGER